MNLTLSDLLQLVSVAVVISAVGYGLFRGVYYVVQGTIRRREEYFKSFDTVVAQLSSSNPSSQLAAAVLLRRYFDIGKIRKDAKLRIETINVISAMLRVLPVGILQKTLADGLAYAVDLYGADLQRANLQNAYLGVKDDKGNFIKKLIQRLFKKRINVQNADFFMADLSYALMENIDGRESVFYNAVLFNARIKNSNFSRANFRGADLKGARLQDVLLSGADFNGAKNIPDGIEKVLEGGIVKSFERITTEEQKNKGQVFFSMPGCLGKREETLTKEYKTILERKGYSVFYYQKDDYPKFGQFTRVRESLLNSSAVIAFGFRQTKIEDGIALPGTPKASRISGKWLNTPWNEVEVGMALMRGLPILLVKDEGIDSGIFDEKLSECFVASIPADYDCRNIDSNHDFISWCDQIA